MKDLRDHLFGDGNHRRRIDLQPDATALDRNKHRLEILIIPMREDGARKSK